MKRSIKLMPVLVLAMAFSAVGAEAINNVADFSADIKDIDAGMPESNWYITDGKTADEIGTIQERSAGNYYFAVNSGDTVIYRTALKTAETEERVTVTEYDLDDGTLYLQAEVKLPYSEPPKDVGDDKLLLWLDTTGQLRVTAGYYDTSFGASGVTPKHYRVYTNGVAVAVTPDEWHKATFRAYKALKLDIYNSAFGIYFDDQALTLAADDSPVSAALQPTLADYLSDEGKTAYYAGRLFPSLSARSDAGKLYGIGASGYGGGIDTIVITNGTPGAIVGYNDNTRHLALNCDPGLTRFDCRVTTNDVEAITVNFKLAGRHKEVSLPIPVEACQVHIEYPVFTNGYQSVSVNCEYPVTDESFTLAHGYGLVSAHLETSRDSEYCACKIGETGYATIAEALAAITGGETVTLEHNCIEGVVVTSSMVFTLDLNGHTLAGPANDGGNWPVVQVESGATLTITDSGTQGTIMADDLACYAVEANAGATLEIQGGTFGNRVDVSSTDSLAITGGNFCDNNHGGEFDLPVASGYVATWIPAGSYYQVHAPTSTSAPTLTSARRSQLTSAGLTLGLSSADFGRMLAEDADPVISITAMDAESTLDGQVRILCKVRIALGGSTAEVNDFLLMELVRVSTDLQHWVPPTSIETVAQDADGEYTVALTVTNGDGDNYFVRLSDQE
ncbi:MAG: hypothetical protein J6P80_04270 [Kiritimatiellae bacterium]|nr:hypothetical protein [Kiritimatiellia bacterium]